jgi:hypothetical protein
MYQTMQDRPAAANPDPEVRSSKSVQCLPITLPLDLKAASGFAAARQAVLYQSIKKRDNVTEDRGFSTRRQNIFVFIISS